MSDSKTLFDQKTQLRQKMLQFRKNLSLSEREPFQKRLLKHLLESGTYSQAQVIMAYLAMPGEVNLDGLIAQALVDGKTVAVPVVTGKTEMAAVQIKSLNELEKGPLGLRQPKLTPESCLDPGEIELILVPGVAFDLQGGRLGMGAGYYDRFLPLADQAMRIGVAWSEQIESAIPRDEHDLPVDVLLTPNGLHLCGFGLPFTVNQE